MKLCFHLIPSIAEQEHAAASSIAAGKRVGI